MPVDIIGVSIPPDTKSKLDELALELGLSRSATIRRLIDERLSKGQPKQVVIDGVVYTARRAPRKKVHTR